VAAEVGADGSFHATLTPVPGINLIQTRVTDGEGNPRSETRALLAGDLQPSRACSPTR
jgi:hypothetical protein